MNSNAHRTSAPPERRHFFARGHSHDCAEDATRANSITSFASYDPSKSPMDGDGADRYINNCIFKNKLYFEIITFYLYLRKTSNCL